MHAMRGAEQMLEEIFMAPLPEEPRRFERQTNRLRGQFCRIVRIVTG